MNRNILLKSILIGINIVLIVFVVSLQLKVSTLEDKLIKADNRANEVSSNTDYEELIVELEKRLNNLEDNDDIGLKQKVYIAEEAIKRLEDLIVRQKNIDIKYGVVKGIEVDDIVSLKIRENELLRGEEAIIALMEEMNMKREEAEAQAERNGYYLKGSDSDIITLEIPNDCRIYMLVEAGLIEVKLTDLVEKVKDEIEENFEDNYTFVLMDNKAVQVYQSYVP